MKKQLIIVLGCMASVAYGQNTAPANSVLTAPGSSKLLTDWIDVHLGIIRTTKGFTHHTRELAYTGVALYESLVPGAPGYMSVSSRLNEYPGTPAVPENTEICWEASANEALATSMRHFYADNPFAIKKIDSMLMASKTKLAKQGYSIKAVAEGSAYGKQVALKVIEWCKSDGSDKSQAAYTVPAGAGYWEPTPPAFKSPATPYLGNERTIIKGSIDNTLPPPPMAFSSDPGSDFYKMVDEVYQNSRENNESYMAIARHWDDFPDGKTMTSGGHWESILKTVVQQKNLSLMDAAGAYAAMYIAMHDAIIGCFKAKYTYNLMRPVTFVRKFMNHSEWNPLIATPSHPEYPAAHATVSTAAATVLTSVLGDNIEFSDNTYRYRNYPERRYASFKEAGKEAGMSRFYGGIHYKPSIAAGSAQGEKIGNNVAKALVFKGQLAGK